MAKKIPFAFAVGGDLTPVPDTSISTELSYQEGWSPDYEKSPEEAGYREIDRAQHNYLWNTVTANIKEWQEQLYPEHQTDTIYPIGMITNYSGVNYIRVNGATVTVDPSVSAEWIVYNAQDGVKKYDANKLYAEGDIVYTLDEGGAITKKRYWEWYSNVESLAGKDPLDETNRRIGWTDVTKPFYWKPYAPKVPGETMAWDTDDIPENMVVGMGQQLPVAVYHTLAASKPEWIDTTDNSLINIPDRQGRFTRAADGATWLAGETHEDAIRNIVGNFSGRRISDFGGEGALYMYSTSSSEDSLLSSETKLNNQVGFDASRVVPTASENQPKAFIEWVGYAL